MKKLYSLGLCLLFVGSAAASETSGPSGNLFSSGNALPIITTDGVKLNVLAFSSASPSITSGFGTSPSITASNGVATFKINVGTGGAATSGVVAMPAASNGWDCVVTPAAAPQAAAVDYSVSTSTTSITITSYTLTTGAALAWTASTILNVNCVGY